ncbi:MAG: hypothetical protein L0387_08805 [Acidobacteria bacterium]|nr:hypothetical protein [Acidobacteriota bacterium]MCI0621755.1 hypothetical protein [Acidobacteriota bacterium]MCI0718357.1 hypothetical protein [Acidobacteriota bacterium]
MNIDFATLYLISVPGFLVGLLTGRFLAGSRWQSIKKSLGVVGKLLSAAGLLALVGASLITLGIMIVYLRHLPETASRTNFWVTLAVGLWMLINLFFEIRDLGKRRNV